jgi:uracil-DNA glycosylase
VICGTRSKIDGKIFLRNPNQNEIENCNLFLKHFISEMKNLKFVFAMGSTALIATNLIQKHDAWLGKKLWKAFDWGNLKIAGCYHPSDRVREDYRRTEIEKFDEFTKNFKIEE